MNKKSGRTNSESIESTPFPSDFKRKESPKEYFCEKLLGRMGRMVGSSKSIYRYDNPKNFIIFNANIATKEEGKIWYGDIDLTKDHLSLQELVSKIGPFYIFYESDLRFEKESSPDFKQAAVIYDEKGFSKGKIFVQLETGANGEPMEIPFEDKDQKVSLFEDSESLFEVIEIPNISKFRSRKETSGWDIFQEALIEMYGKERAKEIYPNLYITKKDNDRIDRLSEIAIKKMKPYLHKVKIDQSVGIDSLEKSCCDFNVDPTWAKSGVGYLKKE